MCTPWLCGRGFGEGGFLLEVPTTDLTVEEMGNAVESVVLICVPSGSSCSVLSSVGIGKTGMGMFYFLNVIIRISKS